MTSNLIEAIAYVRFDDCGKCDGYSYDIVNRDGETLFPTPEWIRVLDLLHKQGVFAVIPVKENS